MKIGQNAPCLRISLIAGLIGQRDCLQSPSAKVGAREKMLKLHLQSYKLCRNCNSWPCSLCLINYDLQILSVGSYKANKQAGRYSVLFGGKIDFFRVFIPIPQYFSFIRMINMPSSSNIIIFWKIEGKSHIHINCGHS